MADRGLGTVVVKYADGTHMTFGETRGATFTIEKGVLWVFDGSDFITAISPGEWDIVDWHSGAE